MALRSGGASRRRHQRTKEGVGSTTHGHRTRSMVCAEEVILEWRALQRVSCLRGELADGIVTNAGVDTRKKMLLTANCWSSSNYTKPPFCDFLRFRSPTIVFDLNIFQQHDCNLNYCSTTSFDLNLLQHQDLLILLFSNNTISFKKTIYPQRSPGNISFLKSNLPTAIS